MTKMFTAILLALSATVGAGEVSDQLCYKPTSCTVPYKAAQAPDKMPPIPEPKVDDKGNLSLGDLVADVAAHDIFGDQAPGQLVAEWEVGNKVLKGLGVLRCRWWAENREIDTKSGGIGHREKGAAGRYYPHSKVCAVFQVSVKGRPGWGDLPGQSEYRYKNSKRMIKVECTDVSPPL